MAKVRIGHLFKLEFWGHWDWLYRWEWSAVSKDDRFHVDKKESSPLNSEARTWVKPLRRIAEGASMIPDKKLVTSFKPFAISAWWIKNCRIQNLREMNSMWRQRTAGSLNWSNTSTNIGTSCWLCSWSMLQRQQMRLTDAKLGAEGVFCWVSIFSSQATC